MRVDNLVVDMEVSIVLPIWNSSSGRPTQAKS